MKTKLSFLLLCSGVFFFNSCKDDPVLSTDLTATITASSLTPEIGSNVTFTIVAHNNGPDNASGVDVTDNLPTGYTFISKTATAGTVGDRAWTIGSLANGKSETLTIVATVLPTGFYPYTVSILGLEADPSTLNNSGLATVVPVNPKIDLSIGQTVSNNAPVIGTNVSFVVTVQNNGQLEATSVSVNNTLGAGYTLVSASATGGTWASPVWTVGKLAKGAKVELTIVATVKESGAYDNTAVVQGAESDTNTANNTSTLATVPVPAVAKITYDNDVKPIFVASCTPCHLAGGTNPNKWDQYSQAKAKITAILDRVQRTPGSSGFMPKVGNQLSAAQISTLKQWVADGLLEK